MSRRNYTKWCSSALMVELCKSRNSGMKDSMKRKFQPEYEMNLPRRQIIDF